MCGDFKKVNRTSDESPPKKPINTIKGARSCWSDVVLAGFCSTGSACLLATQHFPNESWWTFKFFFFLHHKSDDYFLRSYKAEHYPPNVNVTLRSISQKEMWLCPFKVALSWKLWERAGDGNDWACWRSKSGHRTGLKGVCVCVFVCVAPIDSQSMAQSPTLMGFLWLKKVKGEYNDIKTWWLHPGSDHSAPRQLPDRARAGGRKRKRDWEKTREGERERKRAACWQRRVK